MESTKNRELRITRSIEAPIDLMWVVWTSPEHLVNWWGPAGFTTTIQKMDLQEGGKWNLIMQGPDGKNYKDEGIFKEIIPFKKIVMEHFNPHLISTVIFQSVGEETIIDWSLLFDTPEMRENVANTYHEKSTGIPWKEEYQLQSI